MSTIKKQPITAESRLPATRSESDQPKDLRIQSPSPETKEYYQYTRNFPSSNPIRSARPDLLSFVERIPMTQNPGGPSLQNRRELLRKSQRESDPDKENIEHHLLAEIDRLNEEIKGKDDEIKRLKTRNLELEKASSDLKASVHSFTGTPMKEKEAKDLAKRFAKERLQAETDAEEWRQRYKSLEKKVKELESALESKEAVMRKEAPARESKPLIDQQKILDFENKILSLTNENDKLKSMLKERNTEIDNLKVRVGSKDREIDELKSEIRKLGDKAPLDSKIKDLTGQIEIWRNKANLLEEQWEKEQKRTKDLQESRDKYESDLKNAKNDLEQARKLISKQENTIQELERLRNELEVFKGKAEEFEAIKRRFEDSEAKNKAYLQEIEALKQKLQALEAEKAARTEENAREIEVWRKRCDDIEREWGEKYKSLEFEMDELGLMTSNFKEIEEQMAALASEKENWKQKCIEIESEWSQKHGLALQNFEKKPQQDLIPTVFLLMIEIERLNLLIPLIEKDKEQGIVKNRVETEKKAGLHFEGELGSLKEKLQKTQEILKIRETEIEELKKQQMRASQSQENSVYFKQKLQDLEVQLRIRENEIEELKKQQMRASQSQENNLYFKQKVQDLEVQLRMRENEIEELKKQQLRASQSQDNSAYYKQKVHDLEVQLRIRENEIEELKKQQLRASQSQDNSAYYKQKLHDLEVQLRMRENEIEELQKEHSSSSYLRQKIQDLELQLRIRENEVEEIKQRQRNSSQSPDNSLYFKQRVQDLETQVSNLDSLSKEAVFLKEKLRRTEEDLENQTHFAETFKTKYFEELNKNSGTQDSQAKISYYLSENTRLAQELEALKSKHYEESSKKLAWTSQNEDKLAEILHERDEYKQRYYEEISKTSQNSELQAKLSYISKENDRLSSELEDFRKRYYEERALKGGVSQDLEGKVALLASENQRLLHENELLRGKAQNFELENRELLVRFDEKQRIFSEEAVKRSSVHSNYIEEKNRELLSELEDWKSRFSRLDNEFRRVQESSAATSKEIMSLEFELELRNKKIKEFELLINEKNSTLAFHSGHLSQENEGLRRELEELKQKHATLELENYKKGTFDSEYQKKIALLQAEMERSSEHLSEKIKENKGLIEANLQKTRDSEETAMKLRMTETQMAVLDSKVKSLIEEIDAWRIRYENLERFKTKEFEDLRVHNEAIRKSQLDREIRDLTIKHQAEKLKLEAEIKRVQGILEMQTGEVALLKASRTSVENTQFSIQKIHRLEENLFLISLENQRLEAQIASLSEKIQEMELNSLKISEFYQEQQRQSIEVSKKSNIFQVESLEREVISLRNEVEEWKSKARKYEFENYEANALNIQITELRQQNANLTKDHQSLLETLGEKKLYIEKIKEKKRQLKAKLRFSLQNEENSRFLLQEIDKIKRENEDLKDQVFRLETQQKTLSYSSTFESQKIKSLEQELSEWQHKYYEVKAQNDNVEGVKRAHFHQEMQKSSFNSENEELQRKLTILTEELDRWREKCRVMEHSAEDQLLTEHKLRDAEQKVAVLSQENERLSSENARLKNNLLENSGRITTVNTFDSDKYQILEARRLREISELKEHLELLKNVSLLDTRGVEFEAERMAYETAISQMKSKIIDLEKTSALIMKEAEDNKLAAALSTKELEEFRQRLRVFEGRASGVMNIQENEGLRREITDLKEKVFLIERQNREIEAEREQLRATIANLNREKEELTVFMEQRKRESLRNIEELKAENMRLTGERSFTYSSNNQGFYEERNRELQKKISEIEENRNYYKSQAERNSFELTTKNMQLIEKIQELENIKTKYQDSLFNVQRLEAKLLEKLQQKE